MSPENQYSARELSLKLGEKHTFALAASPEGKGPRFTVKVEGRGTSWVAIFTLPRPRYTQVATVTETAFVTNKGNGRTTPDDPPYEVSAYRKDTGLAVTLAGGQIKVQELIGEDKAGQPLSRILDTSINVDLHPTGQGFALTISSPDSPVV